MAWIAITEQFVMTRLSGPELAALKTVALTPGQANPLSEIITTTVNEWRGKLRKFHTLGDEVTIPEELKIHVLAMIRYRLVTRLPGMKAMLDELRRDEWEKANYALNHLDDYVFESPTTVDDATSSTPSPVVEEKTRRFSSDQQDGI